MAGWCQLGAMEACCKTLPTRLTTPMFYLAASQQAKLTQLGLVLPAGLSLPLWVPLVELSTALFSASGGERVRTVATHYGNFVWATEFANVHTTWAYDEQPLVLNGETFGGPEQYFQLMKSLGGADHENVKVIMRRASPSEAFGIGRTHSMRVDWEQVKDVVMTQAVAAKFEAIALRELLLSTGTHPLVQLKPGDGYWGTGPSNKGRNQLGVILQELRTNLRQGP
eukprot:TRINITY_DN92_c0_g1_i1.p2 TRINITY_DN92_c0_g1~~TRINITY_DN92_c0_g1_i1.p2  ORF type:complete len:225 (+),score=23.07 TRINITY_DN92_c0_g1_i1:598-1272(+)